MKNLVVRGDVMSEGRWVLSLIVCLVISFILLAISFTYHSLEVALVNVLVTGSYVFYVDRFKLLIKGN